METGEAGWMPALSRVKEERMIGRAKDRYPPRRVAYEILPSGRAVQVDRTNDSHVTVRVGEDNRYVRWAAVTLPIRSFPLFGKSLARRIREAVIMLDRPIKDEGPDEVEQAVEAALFHGGPTEESGTTVRREPPLVSSAPPPPPPPPARRADPVTKTHSWGGGRRAPEALPDRGPETQPPPSGTTPVDAPSE